MTKEIQDIVNRLQTEQVSNDLIDSVENLLECYYARYEHNKNRANYWVDAYAELRETIDKK